MHLTTRRPSQPQIVATLQDHIYIAAPPAPPPAVWIGAVGFIACMVGLAWCAASWGLIVGANRERCLQHYQRAHTAADSARVPSRTDCPAASRVGSSWGYL